MKTGNKLPKEQARHKIERIRRKAELAHGCKMVFFKEIPAILGISQHAVYKAKLNHSFPSPIDDQDFYKLFKLPEIEAWNIAEQKKKLGDLPGFDNAMALKFITGQSLV